jgi:hypothetical protein
LYFSFEKGISTKIRGFIHDLTKILELKQIPFQLKIEVQLSFRHENAVLYFQQEHYFLVFVIVRHLHIEYSKKKNIFRDVGPLFTFDTKLRGVHFAEDPNESGLSFGKKRSKLLAELYKNNTDEEADLEKLLKKKGYNWKEFYRNSFQKYPYCFRIFKSAKISDKYFSTLGILEQRFKSSYFPAINIVLDISKIILKNAIFSTSKNKMRVDWLKGTPDPLLFKSVSYRLCSDSEKLEVIDFLSRLYLLSVNDALLKITSSIALDCIDRANLTSILQIRFDVISARINNKVGNSLDIIMSLDNVDKVGKAIDDIKYDFEKRGVVSWLPDDAFNPTMSDYGYSFIGTKILDEITKQD